MTYLFRAEDLEPRIGDELALRAVGEAFDAEARGATVLPKRVDTRTAKGFLRLMPAVFEDVMGLKVMTLVQDVGTRYLVLLYDVASGELLAMFDADELTRQRTAATTAVAAEAIVRSAPRTLGLFGTGFEAEAQLRAVAQLWPRAEIVVYSPTTDHREAFARKMSERLGRPVRAIADRDDAARERDVLLLATKSTQPVIDGRVLGRGCAVLSIGATRPDLRELDRATFERAGTVVGDDPAQLESESGDIADAVRSGVLSRERVVAISAVRKDPDLARRDGERDLVVLKTVGTALQDLALARALYRDARENGWGIDIGEVTRLKPFAAQRPKEAAGSRA